MRRYQKDTVPASTRVKRGTYQVIEQWAKETGTSVSEVLALCIENSALARQRWLKDRVAPEMQLQGLPSLGRFEGCGE